MTLNIWPDKQQVSTPIELLWLREYKGKMMDKSLVYTRLQTASLVGREVAVPV